MRKICFHFQISQPYRLRRYHFFDINKHHNYFDDFQNSYLVKRLADFCYLPANKMFLDLLKKYEDISLSFSISGDSIQLFKEHAPEVIESFKELIATNRVEIVGNTFSHSIASLYGKDAFMHQIKKQENN